MKFAAAPLCLALSLTAPPVVFADGPKPDTHDTRDWEGFIDGVMAAQKEAHHYAGAVVVVVSDGRVVFKKGYGFADFIERKPVDPGRTLFRVASNSKMFAWTAVMQLLEQGRLDLHADVNTYLKGIAIPPTFSEPITLAHLMSHTPGFEDRIFGLFAKSPDTRPLVDILRDSMPARIFAPGSVPAYSNYGAALAGLIVEQVSGMPYEQYVEDRILLPLGMTHATVRQPVPARLAADLSKGYEWTGGRLKEQAFEYVPWAPAGAMSVSGEDMGRFMLANLGDGAFGDSRVLRAESAVAMRQPLVSFSPKVNGMLHGFVEVSQNGETAFGHTGATIWFHSATLMLPARKVGVFVAFNTDTGQQAVGQFAEAFFDHYFPVPLAKESSAPRDARASLARFAGTYAMSRTSEHDLTKLIKLFSTSVRVDSDGYLIVRSPNQTSRWRQIEPLVFAKVDGEGRLVFRENDRGDVIDFCMTPSCVIAMRKQPGLGGLVPQLAWLGACLTVFAASLIGFPVAAASQRRLVKPGLSKLARLLGWVTSLVFVAGFTATIAGMTDVNGTILLGVPAVALRLGLTLFVVGSFLTVGLSILTATAWKRKWWHLTGRASVTLVAFAAASVVVWLYQWNLLGWRY
jgi:CubicO group peptidase (beta-lactamase class C family)